MKIKHLILGLGLGVTILGACNDDLGVVGPSIQPPEDLIPVYSDTFRIEMSTVLMDAVYAKTDSALLGEIYDPLYGNLKSDFMSQFYCPDEFKFKHTPIDGKIDSVDYQIKYRTSVGDTLVPMRAQIYLVTDELPKDFYSNVDPEKYCNMQISLGAKTYTAYDQTVSDSIRNLSLYIPTVKIKMPLEFGQKFYDESVNNQATFKNQDAFNQFFPGVYTTTTFGTGNVLNVQSSGMTIYYRYNSKTTAGNDTIISATEVFTVTKEVIQLSRFKNTDMNSLLVPNDQYTYVKSPAGVCTKIIIPTSKIIPVVKERILNNMPLTLNALPQENWKYAFQPAPYLLLLPSDSVKTFFEKGQVPNNKSSFASKVYNAKTLTYNFGNISKLISYQIENNPDKDLELLAIPVNCTTQTNYYNQVTITGVTNYMSPAGIKLRKDSEVTEIVVTSAKYDNN